MPVHTVKAFRAPSPIVITSRGLSRCNCKRAAVLMSANSGGEDKDTARLEKLKAERMALLESLAKLDDEMQSAVTKAMKSADLNATPEDRAELEEKEGLYQKNAGRRQVDPLHSKAQLKAISYVSPFMSSHGSYHSFPIVVFARACVREVDRRSGQCQGD
jgi:hypothetical protein